MSLLKKAANYCVYQERTQKEVAERLKFWGADKEQADEIIVWLIEENFINEGRFAKQYAGSKFRIKKWGKLKIKYALRSKGVSENCIKEAMQDISSEEYKECIIKLSENKRQSISSDTSPIITKKKILDYLQTKGFEYNDIKNALNL